MTGNDNPRREGRARDEGVHVNGDTIDASSVLVGRAVFGHGHSKGEKRKGEAERVEEEVHGKRRCGEDMDDFSFEEGEGKGVQEGKREGLGRDRGSKRRRTKRAGKSV